MPNAASVDTGRQKSSEKVVSLPSLLFERLPKSITIVSGASVCTTWMPFRRQDNALVKGERVRLQLRIPLRHLVLQDVQPIHLAAPAALVEGATPAPGDECRGRRRQRRALHRRAAPTVALGRACGSSAADEDSPRWCP